VVYQDGSLLAQLGEADMRMPIANAMAWPTRIHSGVKPIDLCQTAGLHFKALDAQRYPAFALGYQALQMGGTAPCVLNAANEVAVAAFLQHRIPFTAIATINRETLAQAEWTPADHFEGILECDQQARRLAQHLIDQHFF
jgi:1-deoxy-D-xylulose-5-phosphate reductoisomerase